VLLKTRDVLTVPMSLYVGTWIGNMSSRPCRLLYRDRATGRVTAIGNEAD
jgi:hypothetical protein